MEDKERKDFFNDDNKSYTFKIIVIALLVIIILLLLLQSCGNIKNTGKGEYTGNYDIYEITLKGTCECPICETCDNTCKDTDGGNKKTSGNVIKPEVSTYEPEEDMTGFVVYDEEDKWSAPSEDSYQATIFRHSSYEVVDGKIAPGVENVYKFIVRNLNDFEVEYTITALENNPKGINMKYRLRSETEYILGGDSHWVDGSDLTTSLKTLNARGRDTYYLDWKWFDDDVNDTPIGIDDTSTYSIYLKVDAEEK